MVTHAEKIAALKSELSGGGAARVGLAKETSNLFRDRAERPAPRINLKHFNRVLKLDTEAGIVEAEGMTTFADLADATLAHGLMPQVVPQLKSITVGGALAGVGIEATSFRFGLVHDTVASFDVLTGDGRIVTCTRDNEHRDLFYGFPNAYGTLGYALRVAQRTTPVSPYVQVEHLRYRDPSACFADVPQLAHARDTAFLDGVVFAPGELYLCRGSFVDTAPYTSDYTYEHIYYRSIRERGSDFLKAHDYLWRWDTDWFWCSKNVGAQNPILRRLYGRKRLGSRHYQRIMRWNSRRGYTHAWFKFRGGHHESVIQDVDIPIGEAPRFLDFFQREIGIAPVWMCPMRTGVDAGRFPLFPIRPGSLYVNFGFWDMLHRRTTHPDGHFNRLIEAEVLRLGGIKSLYSDSYFERDAFDVAYGGDRYRELKAKYDPQGAFPELYAKCVLRG